MKKKSSGNHDLNLLNSLYNHVLFTKIFELRIKVESNKMEQLFLVTLTYCRKLRSWYIFKLIYQNRHLRPNIGFAVLFPDFEPISYALPHFLMFCHTFSGFEIVR